MKEALESIDQANLAISEGGLLVLNIAIAIIMFGVALEIKVAHFKNLFKKPKPVLVGVISQFFLLPALTFSFCWIFRSQLSIGVCLGMILVASCPGGNVSNFMSTMSKGNAALSVTLTAIATTAAIFMTPLNFSLWGGLIESTFSLAEKSPLLQELKIDVYSVFKTVLVLLGIPIFIGMIFNHIFPKITKKIKKFISAFSIVFFAGMVIVLFANNYENFINYISWILLIVFLHNALALSTGFYFARLFKLKKQNCRTIAIETGIQNSGLGLVLLFNTSIFPEHLRTEGLMGGMMIVTAWWGIWHIISGLSIASYFRRKPLKKEDLANIE